MPQDKPFPPEQDPEFDKDTVRGENANDEPESQDQLIDEIENAASAALDDALSESQFNPVVSDVHDLPTLEMEDEDDETDDILPVKPHDPAERSDPRKTLPGSGGFDPNPDFASEDTPFDGGQTQPHIVPFQHTLVHVPGEEHRPVRSSQPAQPPNSRTLFLRRPASSRRCRNRRSTRSILFRRGSLRSRVRQPRCRLVPSRARAGFSAVRPAARRSFSAYLRPFAAA